MRKAVNACTIGDKLYNMERIHSKLIYIYDYNILTTNDKNIIKLNIVIDHLLKLVDCFDIGQDSIATKNYKQSISQTKYLIELDSIDKATVLTSFHYMHGCFVKYREFIKKDVKRGCELLYQEVCLPILQIELEKRI